MQLTPYQTKRLNRIKRKMLGAFKIVRSSGVKIVDSEKQGGAGYRATINELGVTADSSGKACALTSVALTQPLTGTEKRSIPLRAAQLLKVSIHQARAIEMGFEDDPTGEYIFGSSNNFVGKRVSIYKPYINLGTILRKRAKDAQVKLDKRKAAKLAQEANAGYETPVVAPESIPEVVVTTTPAVETTVYVAPAKPFCSMCKGPCKY